MMVRRLPPGVDGRDFTRALAAFRVALGRQWVLTEGAVGLPGYADPQPVLDDGHFSASAALMPGTVEDVRAVVRIAGAFGVPLSPVLPGRDPGFGGPAPRLPGAVAVDLARLNRVVGVDPAGGYAVVEPGVTFQDLADRLAGLAPEHRVTAELRGPRWASVVGEALERSTGGAGYEGADTGPYGMEIVLADGDVVRTGMAALTGAGSGPWTPYGCGPALGPMFARSAFGIVTKLGVRLGLEPAARRAYAVALPREDDLGPLVDALRPLLADRTVTGTLTVRSVLLQAAAGGRTVHGTGPGPLPDSAVRALRADLGIGYWNLYGELAGAPAVMDAQWSVVRDALAAVPGARFRGAGDGLDRVPVADEPDRWLPNGGRLDLTPVSPTTGEDALAQYALARDHAHAYGKDYLGAFAVGVRELHHRFTAVFDTLDPDDRALTLELCRALIRAAAAAGYGVQRAHPVLMDQVAETYGFNDHAVRRLGERIKDALDAEGILAPGKHGIWPRRYRGLGL
ncbi:MULTISPECIES: FAD-binding oxidoreductase [unclassified Streptomyces]|uniref:FAD-binding oxidoreductase n=1 Tax=unclassified Streptomyces TaxID=2593676 RepID=UPI000DAD3F14|nr:MULTISPECIES: FAD-binding protein [unclassified Streptomyces]PZT72571.1 FAD-binding oxidoreductase [Streptomyces sp. AC1-42T]PZT81111.1 FAD-binding oxidoreductase [Streptomyces sp. AC1-42W]